MAKGGVGKTSLAGNVAWLAARDRKTLIVDGDPQGSVSSRASHCREPVAATGWKVVGHKLPITAVLLHCGSKDPPYSLGSWQNNSLRDVFEPIIRVRVDRSSNDHYRLNNFFRSVRR